MIKRNFPSRISAAIVAVAIIFAACATFCFAKQTQAAARPEKPEIFVQLGIPAASAPWPSPPTAGMSFPETKPARLSFGISPAAGKSGHSAGTKTVSTAWQSALTAATSFPHPEDCPTTIEVSFSGK